MNTILGTHLNERERKEGKEGIKEERQVERKKSWNKENGQNL